MYRFEITFPNGETWAFFGTFNVLLERLDLDYPQQISKIVIVPV